MTSSQCKSPSSPKRTIATYRYGRCRRSAGPMSGLPLSSCRGHPLARTGRAVARGPCCPAQRRLRRRHSVASVVSRIRECQRAALATSASQSSPAVPVVPLCLRVITASPRTLLENPSAHASRAAFSRCAATAANRSPVFRFPENRDLSFRADLWFESAGLILSS